MQLTDTTWVSHCLNRWKTRAIYHFKHIAIYCINVFKRGRSKQTLILMAWAFLTFWFSLFQEPMVRYANACQKRPTRSEQSKLSTRSTLNRKLRNSYSQKSAYWSRWTILTFSSYTSFSKIPSATSLSLSKYLLKESDTELRIKNNSFIVLLTMSIIVKIVQRRWTFWENRPRIVLQWDRCSKYNQASSFRDKLLP